MVLGGVGLLLIDPYNSFCDEKIAEVDSKLERTYFQLDSLSKILGAKLKNQEWVDSLSDFSAVINGSYSSESNVGRFWSQLEKSYAYGSLDYKYNNLFSSSQILMLQIKGLYNLDTLKKFIAANTFTKSERILHKEYVNLLENEKELNDELNDWDRWHIFPRIYFFSWVKFSFIILLIGTFIRAVIWSFKVFFVRKPIQQM